MALRGSARAYAPREAGSILHIGKFYPPHRGGMESHVYDLAVRQARTGNVRVIAASDNFRAEISEPEGVQLHRVGRLATVASMPVCPRLVAAIRNAPANLVHVHTPNPGAALAFLLSGHAGKLVITHHADTMGRKLLRKLSDPFVVRAMQHASRIIVTSGRYLNSSPELAPFRDKCHVIPLGIDLRAQNPVKVSDVRDLRERFGDRIIVAVGRLVPYKGFDVLIRAMRSVEAHLLLIGSGPLAAKLGDLAAESGVAHRVTMLDRVGDLAPYFAVASLFVLPSVTRAEAFGIVQVEAMAAGLPVINTDLDSGVPEVSRHAETGFTVPPADAAALAYAVALLLERNDLRAQFAAAAVARARTEFSADRMAVRTMSLYDEVLDSARYAA